MTLYKTIDYLGFQSAHDCINEEIAKQAHLLHYGLISTNFVSVSIIDESEIFFHCTEENCINYIKELEKELENKQR